MASIDDIKGINARIIEEFASLGIRTTERLLEFGASRRARQELSLETGISEDKMLKLVNRADLFRIKAIGSELSDLLRAAGINNVPELARRTPGNLHNALVHLNEERKLLYRIPSLNELKDMIAQAKQLPEVVTY